MATYGYISESDDMNMYHHQYFGILAYSVDHNLGHVEFVEEAEFGLGDPESRNLIELVKKFGKQDILIFINKLNQSTWEMIGLFMDILKSGATVYAVVGEHDIVSKVAP